MSALGMQSLKALFSPTDEQLMWRVQMQDDAQAFAELVGRWEGPIHGLCTRITGDLHRGEDLAQEAFSRLFYRRKAYRTGHKLSTYLWRIALNLCYDELRRTGRRREEPLDTGDAGESTGPGGVASEGPSPDEQLVREETGQAVRQALMGLPEDERTIVVMRHYQDLKFREIAEILDLPEGTVKTRMTEALNHLSRLLKSDLELHVRVPPGKRTRPKEYLLI